MLPERIVHNYENPRPEPVIASGGLFAVAYVDGMYGLYIDDDGVYCLQATFHVDWTRDLIDVAKQALIYRSTKRVMRDIRRMYRQDKKRGR